MEIRGPGNDWEDRGQCCNRTCKCNSCWVLPIVIVQSEIHHFLLTFAYPGSEGQWGLSPHWVGHKHSQAAIKAWLMLANSLSRLISRCFYLNPQRSLSRIGQPWPLNPWDGGCACVGSQVGVVFFILFFAASHRSYIWPLTRSQCLNLAAVALQSGLLTRADLSVSIHDILVSIHDESGLRSVVQLPPEHFNKRKFAKRKIIIIIIFTSSS